MFKSKTKKYKSKEYKLFGRFTQVIFLDLYNQLQEW